MCVACVFWIVKQIIYVLNSFVKLFTRNNNTRNFNTIISTCFRDLIQDVLERYLSCDAQIIEGTRLSSNIRKQLKIVKKRAITIWLTLMIIPLIHCIGPFFRPGRHFPEDKYILYGLHPMTESPNYEIATIIFTITITNGTYSVANGTAFIIVVFGYTEAQLLSLSEELINIWNDAREYYIDNFEDKTEDINNFVEGRLKFIIKLHIENIILLRQVEAVLRVSMALEFVALTIGLTAALLGGLENTYLEIPFCLSQIFISCYIGQKIIDASNFFENAVYACNWEKFDIANQKIVLTMLQNSQKTLKLSAGGVAFLSNECLMSIIKSCYSFYTTLQSTLK
ncbi:uncharacterized protein LOC126965491 [Leptidea sinapis]|uniref:uncharacterized protein LOC126965491 n=1 Tax=Leptidea sinapis TaxID=189913 RepID=UPI0021C47CD6|nr:uncharacterized protein LOC126965491 [Leptidea sinapis]